MRWFKHLTGSLKDPMISDLISEFGGDGYLVFFGILDMMAEDFDETNPGISTFSLHYLTKNLQVSRQKVVRILTFLQNYPKKNGKILHKIDGDKITLKCIRLKELADDWTKKLLRSNSEVTPAQEVEVEVEVDKEEENTKEIYSLLFDFWNSQNIIIHKKIDSKTLTKIKSALKDYSLDEIKESIENYSVVLKSEKHYFKYKWALQDFLARGIHKFLTSADPINNFKNKDIPKQQKSLQNFKGRGSAYYADIKPDLIIDMDHQEEEENADT